MELSLFRYRCCAKEWKTALIRHSEKGNKYGTALCLRPQSSHYSCETKLTNVNESLKGLTLYGDDKNLVVWEPKEIKFF